MVVRPPPRTQTPASDVGTGCGVVALLAAAAGLLGLLALVTNPLLILGIVGIIGGFFALGLFHYLTWGRWLSEAHRAEQQRLESEEAAALLRTRVDGRAAQSENRN